MKDVRDFILMVILLILVLVIAGGFKVEWTFDGVPHTLEVTR